MAQFNVGLLTRQEADLLEAASLSSDFLEKAPPPVHSIPFPDFPFPDPIHWRLGYYLADTLSNGLGYVRDHSARSCLILVVNRLPEALGLFGVENWAGQPWGSPRGTRMHPFTGALNRDATDFVPAADKYGHAGFGCWMFVNAQPNGEVSFGLGFGATAALPCAMSLGVRLWNASWYAISLLATNDAAGAQNQAFYDDARSPRHQAVVDSDYGGRRVRLAARIQPMLDPNENHLIVVSVTSRKP
jgi:hypothetical protein